MRTTAPSMIASVLLLTVANGWAVDPGGDLDAIIKHRAERRIETPSNRPDMARVPVPARLFHMRATDHVRCVRAVDDINGDSLPEVIATIDQSQSDNIFCLDAGLPSVFNDGFESGGTEGWSATMN